MIKAIVFDFDGVLVESVDIKTKAFAQLFEKEGAGVVRSVVDYHNRHTGVSRFEKFTYIYKNILKRDLSQETFDALCREFAGIVVDEVVAAPYVRGAKEFLDAKASAYACFVASATPQEEIEEIVRLRKMHNYFVRVYGAPFRKADAVKEALKACRIMPGDLLYVGDALSDLEAATSNGCRFIARISGNEELFDRVACVKVRDLSGLVDEIQKMEMSR